MSRIAILGASGGLGSLLVHEALDAGMNVNALTRNPRRLTMANEHLNVFEGDVDSGRGLEQLIAGCRFVVSVAASPNPADAVSHVIKAVGLKRVDRVVFVSRLGGPQAHGVKGLLTALVKPRAREVEHDLGDALELVRVSGLDYVVIHTVGLTDARAGHGVSFSDVGSGGLPPTPVGRHDLAHFILMTLTAPGWSCREVLVRAGKA